MDGLTFVSRLAALIPPPRFHVVSYYGVLAPAASRRAAIVPGHDDVDELSACVGHRAATATATSTSGAVRPVRKRPRPERRLWAELMQRVFQIDVLRCPCGGRRRVLAMIFSQASIERVLTALGLPCEAEPRAPPRPVQGVLGFGG